MKILMIEDNFDTIEGLIDAIVEREWDQKTASFEDAENMIYSFDPDVVVMDWMYDAEDADKGAPILENIVGKEFRPVIVFSAHDLSNILEDKIKEYPLINFTRKGGDDSELANTIDEWKEPAIAISNMRHSMNNALIESARALTTFQAMDTFPNRSIVSYMLSRRAMQYFENAEVSELPPAWIQYLYPPINDYMLVCDIVRKYSEDTNQNVLGLPQEYFVILTPSCDMVNHSGDQFKVLVAHCCGKERFSDQRLGESSIDSSSGIKKVDRVKSELQYGYNKSLVALPELPNILPYMTINLKDLDYVLISEISNSRDSFNMGIHKYYRVASIASPFREQIVWAHMINSCRPGMPERDTESWAKGILIE